MVFYLFTRAQHPDIVCAGTLCEVEFLPYYHLARWPYEIGHDSTDGIAGRHSDGY